MPCIYPTKLDNSELLNKWCFDEHPFAETKFRLRMFYAATKRFKTLLEFPRILDRFKLSEQRFPGPDTVVSGCTSQRRSNNGETGASWSICACIFLCKDMYEAVSMKISF